MLDELTGERSLDARTWKLFRYPSLIEGVDAESRTAIRRGLLGCGYRIAPVTVDFSDWAYSEPYERCARRGDYHAMDQIQAEYLAGARQALEWNAEAAKRLIGRPIKRILLLQISRLGAVHEWSTLRCL